MPPDFVIPDANVLIALCAQEADKFAVADAQMQKYAEDGCIFHAPGALVAEVVFILCGKLMRDVLSPAEHSIAVQTLTAHTEHSTTSWRRRGAGHAGRADSRRVWMQPFGGRSLHCHSRSADQARQCRTKRWRGVTS